MGNCRVLAELRTASVAAMLSVTVIISMGAAPTRATAPPEKTPCVT